MNKSNHQNNERYTNRWTLSFNNFSGFAPQWYANSYPFFGNKNQASYMKNIDITDSNVLTQGPRPSSIDEATPLVTTHIKAMTKTPMVIGGDSVYFGIGGNKIYKFDDNGIVNDAHFPHTITKSGKTDIEGEDIVYYDNKIYYSYNHSGNAGDIGEYNLTTFDDDWGSTAAPLGPAELESGPHQFAITSLGRLVFTNGSHIGYYDYGDVVFETEQLVYDNDVQTASAVSNGGVIHFAANRPVNVGSNYRQSVIYTWNGSTGMAQENMIQVNGKIGALWVKNGIVFVWWYDNGTNLFGYIDGQNIIPLKRFPGSLPLYYQVCEIKSFIAWISDGEIYLWGAGDTEVAMNMSKYASYSGDVSGGIASPFGELIGASTRTVSGSTTYYIEELKEYTVDSEWRSVCFDVSSPMSNSYIDKIFIVTEPLEDGAKCDFVLQYNYGKTSKNLTQIAFSAENKTRWKILERSLECENFRIDIKWANGSTTKPVKIRGIYIEGRSNKNN